MADNKPELSRAGTMQVTSKEGQAFLDKNLTDWKKPYLADHFESEGGKNSTTGSKPKMSKHTTMKGTAKEAENLLGADKPDTDALTRGQQKKIENIKAEGPPAKKSRMARDSTMAATTKEAKTLLKGEKLADTRGETKAKGRKPAVKRKSTIAKTMDEAQAVYGDLSKTTTRQTRSAGKPALKKTGTMQATAKEGKAYLKRGKKGKKAAKVEEEDN